MHREQNDLELFARGGTGGSTDRLSEFNYISIKWKDTAKNNAAVDREILTSTSTRNFFLPLSDGGLITLTYLYICMYNYRLRCNLIFMCT
jgi:hypothetical protein